MSDELKTPQEQPTAGSACSAGLGPGWTLIFAAGCSIQMFRTLGDPQRGAIEVRKDHPWLDGYYFVAAVEGTARILPADTARTSECGLEGWPA